MRNDIAILALEYKEQNYKHTVNCLKASGYPYYFADRAGVGNFSKAFNDAFRNYRAELEGKKYIFLVTNITFDPTAPERLAAALDEHPEAGAICPVYGSDHKHLQPNGSSNVVRIPYIELTAAMFSLPVYEKFLLNENLHYYYMDIYMSMQMKEAGVHMLAHHGVPIGHVYLRNGVKEPITRVRERLRYGREAVEHEYLKNLLGADWRAQLWNYEL